jgi:hypothetical protein
VGPTGRVFVTRALTDVTKSVDGAVYAVADDLARQRALEKLEKETIRDCEKDRPGIRCEMESFYDGSQYFLIERLELRDVRLVYAPPAGIGNFGGEVDNWRWPRHTGDFAFFRAYAGKDGTARDHDAENVPYQNPHHLKLATRPLAEGDLAIVAGYPGRTSSLAVPRVVKDTIEWLYPRRLRMFDDYIRAIEAVTKDDPEAAIKGVGWLRRFNNYRTKHQGELFGLDKGKVLERKLADERALREAAEKDPRLVLARNALDAIDAALTERDRTREADTALMTEILMPRVVWAANLIVRMAEERQKPDELRDPDYQDRKVPDLRAELQAMDRRYHPKVDRALLTLALDRVLATAPADRTPALELIAGKDPTPERIRTAVGKLYEGTKLSDDKTRLELFDRATPASLAKSRDAAIRLAIALRPLIREIEEREDRYLGKFLVLGRARLQGLATIRSGGIGAPDANRTIRVSYGTVRRPASGEGRAFTLLSEVVKKHQDKEPFDAPDGLLEAVKARRFGVSFVPALGDVPVDFLTDVQITNGSSGSPTLDRDGRLTGLAFDGTYESVASDWVYLPGTRSIHVDLRYVLWVLGEVARADALLAELGAPRR